VSESVTLLEVRVAGWLVIVTGWPVTGGHGRRTADGAAWRAWSKGGLDWRLRLGTF